MDASKYDITVQYGIYEGEPCFEARVSELPAVVEYADTYSDAYALVIDAIEVTAEILAEKGKLMPPPTKIPRRDGQ